MMTLVLISALAAATRTSSGAQRHALEMTVLRTKARWQAEGCASVGLAALNRAMAHSHGGAWDSVDAAVQAASASTVVNGCRLRAVAVGSVLGVTQYDARSLVRLLQHAGIASGRADSLAAALMDWVDPDDIPLNAGAERDWYHVQRRPGPRNGQLRDHRELLLVRGFESPGLVADTMSKLLGIDSVRLAVPFALPVILRTIPGVSDAEALQMLRTRQGSVDETVLPAELSAGRVRRPAMVAHPDAWQLIAQVFDASGDLVAERNVMLGRTESRVAVLRVTESP